MFTTNLPVIPKTLPTKALEILKVKIETRSKKLLDVCGEFCHSNFFLKTFVIKTITIRDTIRGDFRDIKIYSCDQKVVLYQTFYWQFSKGFYGYL